MYVYSGTLLARPPTGWHSTGRVSEVGVVAPHFPKGFMHYRDHFISTFFSLIESYLSLSYVLPEPTVLP